MVFIKDGKEIKEEISQELENYAKNCNWPLEFLSLDGQYWLSSNKDSEKPIGIEIDSELERHQKYFKSHSLLKEVLAKAIGIKSGVRPKILDLTAGLLGDSLLFLAMGCEVSSIERNPVISFIIESALKNATHPLLEKFHFSPREAEDALVTCSDVDVIFYDPMFEDANLKSGAKKEMRIFRELIGKDQDSLQVFEMLLKSKVKRVVIKRPRLSQYLGKKPDVEYMGKATRYDVYFPKTMAQS